ncbi:MAG: hypothetical protein COU25_02490 [Candidatus Levybacteria bacterium CG10_big_fil_rev_8_21_14_0_10_35_13]|nr:MAG: hypothetical protein COU25_02490 [Candidatus Levybacteria bacterium CG10_big_fil_rev_8_21_14_0_10_35_13]
MLRAGEKLQEIRLEKDLTLEEVSENTKIKKKFLEHIENGEYNKLPSVSYAQGFVRNYAKYLGISDREILALFRREFDEDKAFRILPKGFESKEHFPVKGLKTKYTFFAVILVFAVFLSYIGFQYRYAFLNPPLDVNSPSETQNVVSSRLEVSGKTDPNAAVYVNEALVNVDSNGYFNKTISVFPGKLIIDVKAINKFGRTTEVKRNVEVKPAY